MQLRFSSGTMYFGRRGYTVFLTLLLVCIIVFLSRYWLFACNLRGLCGSFDLPFGSAEKICEENVPNITMSRSFEQLYPGFKLATQKASGAVGLFGGASGVVGHSFQAIEQFKTMHYLAGKKHVKTACETGFNFGHSSFNYLTANDQLIVHSFDFGQKHAQTMSNYMSKTFPGRFFIHFGNSIKTLTKFVQDNPNFKCDLMFVDGGHDYPAARSDVTNFALIANLKENVILFDDYPTDWGQDHGKAWDEMVKAGVIEEKMRCSFKYSLDGCNRGYTIGRILKRPDRI